MAITSKEIEAIQFYSKKSIPKYPYWYGMKKALYEMVDLPNWLPASCHLEHGAVSMFKQGKPNNYILSNPYPVIFLSNKEQLEHCKAYPVTKPSYVLGSLFPRYRRFKKIEKSPTAKGSLVFTGHSTKSIAVESDWEELIAQFKALPDIYHPLTVSIYFIDYLKGVHLPFLDAGFDVVTAGHISDPNFIDNFYDILSRFNYVVSTDVGSHLYYAIEMGIPFFIYGTPGSYHSEDKEFKERGKNYKMKDLKEFNAVNQLFTPTKEEIKAGIKITEEQKNFVHQSIGTYDALPLQEVREIIQKHQWKFYAKESLKVPVTLPLKFYREIKAKF